MISLIAFLGNVGREYERTRHNAAWIAADHLNICAGISWQHKFRGLYGRFPAAVSGGAAVHALKPETYMNLSGEAVGEAAQFFKIPPAEILIVHDELEVVGRARRAQRASLNKGSAGDAGLLAAQDWYRPPGREKK